MLPLQAIVDLEMMAINGYSTFSKALAFPKASPSDFLVSYPGDSLRESYPSAEKQSMYSTAPADWATKYQELVEQRRIQGWKALCESKEVDYQALVEHSICRVLNWYNS